MRLRKLGIGLLAVGLVGLLGSAALAQPPGKGKPGPGGKGFGKQDKMKFKGKYGAKGRGGWGAWGGSFGGMRGGFAHRGFAHRGHRHHGRYASASRGHRGRYAGRGFRGHRGRHAWRGGSRGIGRHGHRGYRGRFADRGRIGRFGHGWGRPGMGGRFGRPGFGKGFGGKGFGGKGFAGKGFAGKGFAGKGAFAMGFGRGGLMGLKLSEEQQKKLAELRKTEAASIKKALETSRQDMQKGLKGILTAEQYKKYEEATKRFKAPDGKGKGKGKEKGKRKPKDDVESSAAPELSVARPAVTIAEASRDTAARFARKE